MVHLIYGRPKSGATHRLMTIILSNLNMYTDAKTVVRTVNGNSKGFDVKVGMQQGSALIRCLFTT